MNPLRIAVDARPLAFPMVGITRYTSELIQRLARTPHEWFLYLDRPPAQAIPARTNVHVRIGRMTRAASSTGFAQLAFPRWALRDDIDVFWSPRHHLPLLLPGRVKQLLTIHDMVWREFPETMTRGGRWVERLLMPPSIRAADTIITVSEATRQDVVKWSRRSAGKTVVIHSGLTMPEGPVETVPNTSNAPQTSNAQDMPDTRGIAGVPKATDATKVMDTAQHPCFLFVGTLEPRKNLRRLLHAFARVAARDPAVRLVIVGGEGWGDESLSALVSTLQLDERVTLAGRTDDASLAAYYRQATALVMPSLYEGFGLPLLEAMGHGVPVITSNRGATAEIAADAGLLVDPLDEAAIADAMFTLMDPQQRDSLAGKARRRAAQFDWDSCARAVLEEIEKLCPGGGRAADA